MSEGTTAEELKELGNQAFANQDFETAVEKYSQAIVKDPKNHVFYSNRSASYAGLQDYDKAEADAKECIRLDPTFLKGYYRLSTALMKQGHLESATHTIKQGLAINPNHPELTKQLRNVQQQQKVKTAKQQQAHSSQTTPTAVLDPSQQTELQELQSNLRSTSILYQSEQANLKKYNREQTLAELTHAELETVGERSACYRAIGKVFVQYQKRHLQDYLQHAIANLQVTTKESQSKLQYLEKQMHSQQENINELVGN